MADIQFELPYWYDLHAHFRQEELLKPMAQAHLDMACAGILAMPNTKPPVGKVFEADALGYWSIESYRAMLDEAAGGQFSEIIVPLYLTADTTPQMIEEGAKKGVLKACKYYPPHGTTGSEHSSHFKAFIENGVFEAMADNGVVLCVHGEAHDMSAEDYFARHTNAEEEFYRNWMPPVAEKYPALKIVAEHVTTEVAADFVRQAGSNVGATVTPQHLIYTVGHMLKGFKYHLYCMPLVKFENDREALRKAVTASDNTQFFAGTDSAPHTHKATSCGCAAGCFTGKIAPQLYAEAFELSDVDMGSAAGQAAFEKFLCTNGAAFYDLPVPQQRFTLTKRPETVAALPVGAHKIVPLPVGMNAADDNETVEISWSLSL